MIPNTLFELAPHRPEVSDPARFLEDFLSSGLRSVLFKGLSEGIQSLVELHSDIKVVGEAATGRQAVEMAKKLSPNIVIMDIAIREIRKGAKVFSPAVQGRLQADQQLKPGSSGLSARNIPLLTSREIEVVQLIAEGKANKQVAAELRISIKTVEKHRPNLMNKLKIHDTASLTRYAISEGIVESTSQATTDQLHRNR